MYSVPPAVLDNLRPVAVITETNDIILVTVNVNPRHFIRLIVILVIECPDLVKIIFYIQIGYSRMEIIKPVAWACCADR